MQNRSLNRKKFKKLLTGEFEFTIMQVNSNSPASYEMKTMNEQITTKEKYIVEALKLFAERGYHAVKLSEIAERVGVTTSTLYKHYENKQQLFDAIIEESKRGYSAAMHSLQVDFGNNPESRDKLLKLTDDDLAVIADNLLCYSFSNEMAAAFRKLMMVEQFRNKELAAMYDERYIHLQYEQHAELFKLLISAGKMKEADPYTLAVMYVSPITLFIGMVDRNPEMKDWAREKIREHVREFCRCYRLEE